MDAVIPALASEFLEAYPRDFSLRWTAAELAEQVEFVSSNVSADEHWLDWSTPTAALQLLQAAMFGTPLSERGGYAGVLIAGPVTELIASELLIGQAAGLIRNGGKMVAIIPCLRDNSPESQLFTEIARAEGWPYQTAEELHETFRENGFAPEAASLFVPVRRFVESAVANRLCFQGFSRIFKGLEAQGYDPFEVGWGEARVIASAIK